MNTNTRPTADATPGDEESTRRRIEQEKAALDNTNEGYGGPLLEPDARRGPKAPTGHDIEGRIEGPRTPR